MAKRASVQKKTSRSRKTKKRLAVKHERIVKSLKKHK